MSFVKLWKGKIIYDYEHQTNYNIRASKWYWYAIYLNIDLSHASSSNNTLEFHEMFLKLLKVTRVWDWMLNIWVVVGGSVTSSHLSIKHFHVTQSAVCTLIIYYLNCQTCYYN